MSAVIFISLIAAATPEVSLETARYLYISGDFSDIVASEGVLLSASGFGLSVIPADLASAEHIPTKNYSTKVAVEGKRAFLGEANLVTEFDLSSKPPRMLASYEISGNVTALAANDRFVAAGTDGAKLIIFERKDGHMSTAELDARGPVHDLLFYGDILYSACGSGGVQVIKVDENSSTINTLPVSGAQALTAAQDYLFIGTNISKMWRFSIKNPGNPEQEVEFESSSPVVALASYNKLIYAAQGYQGYSVFKTNGGRIELADPFREGYVADVLPTKEGLFLALREKGIVLLGGKNPAKLAETTGLQQSAPSIHTSRSGAYWAVAQSQTGSPILKWDGQTLEQGYATPRPSYAAGVLLSGTNLYVADVDRGVSIFSLKSFPVAERTFDLFQPGKPMRIALSQDLIYIAAGDKGMRVLWICPCGPLKQKAAFEQGVKAVDVAVKDSIAYVADPDSGLRVVVSRPAAKESLEFEQIQIYSGVISPQALLLEGDILYVADSIGAVIALDVSQPKNPVQLSFSVIGSRPYGLALAGETLWVACGKEGILPVDVSEPRAPVAGKFIDTPGNALAVAASDEYLGIADYTSWNLMPLKVTDE